MYLEKDRSRLFNRRAAVVWGGKLALFAALTARLQYLQISSADHYKLMAEDNRINLRLLPPPRGAIVDSNGAHLAVNVQNYRIMLIPEQANSAASVPVVLERLRRLVRVEDHDIRRVIKETGRRRPFVPVTVRENLTWEELSRVGVNAPDLPGVGVDVGRRRHYPEGPAVAHVLGYVAAVGSEDLTGDPLLELPGFQIGKRGLEKTYDLALRGKSGNSKVEVNAIGRAIRELERQEGEPGHEIRLTADIRLQRYVSERLSTERAASAVVLNARDGAVLALASTPSFDPNAFSGGLQQSEWEALLDNPYKPLNNKAVAGQYAPGSTFKIAVALAAMAQGIGPDLRVYCNGYVEVGDRRFHCWKKQGHGMMDMTGALRESCDSWFYEVSRRIGIDRIAAMARKLGFGAGTGLDLQGERAGLVPDRDWKQRVLGTKWQVGETLVAGIGQGYMLATPLQLAVAFAQVVNGGYRIRPYLALQRFDARGALIGPRETPSESLEIPRAHLEAVMRGMNEAVNHPLGTAAAAAITAPKRRMGGKTGTSQVRRISQAERDAGVRRNEDMVWRLRDHALFVGYAPLDKPHYVASVVVEHGGSGGSIAAPIVRDILEKAQLLEQQAPPPPRKGEAA